MIRSIRKHPLTKGISALVTISFLVDLVNPLAAYAVSGGTTQAEFSGFNQASMSELVNPATGDFSYNIPLLSVEGYPINLSYNAGVTMDEEASWVGLGWTLNPGALNRVMRGLPDDFKGEEIDQKIHLKKNYTVGAEQGQGGEFLGAGDGFGANASIGHGISYNNYRGFNVVRDASIGLRVGKVASASVGLDVSMSNNEGVTLSPHASLGLQVPGKHGIGSSTTIGVGTSINSRSGMAAVSWSLDASVSQKVENDTREPVKNSRGTSSSASIPIGTGTYIPTVQFPKRIIASEARIKNGWEYEGGLFGHAYQKGFAVYEEVKSQTLSAPAYGYLYQEEAEGDLEAMLDFNRENDGMVNSETPNIPLASNTYDLFTATAQGLSAQFRAHRNDIGTVYDNEVQTNSSNVNGGGEQGVGDIAEGGGNFSTVLMEQTSSKWANHDGSGLTFIDKIDPADPDYYNYEKLVMRQSGEGLPIPSTHYANMGYDDPVRMQYHTESASKIAPKMRYADGTVANGNTVDNSKNESRVKRAAVISYLTAEDASDLALEKEIERYDVNDFDYQLASATTADHIYGEGYFDSHTGVSPSTHANNQGHHISEVTVTTDEGKRYVYGIPVYNRQYYEQSFNVNGATNTPKYADGLIEYDANQDGLTNNSNKDGFYLQKSIPDYATSYLLTAALSTDYVDVSGNGPSVDDLGSYTKFNYSRVDDDYWWRQPYEKGHAHYNPGFRCETEDDRGNYTDGHKELWYLHSIETKNYIAEFELGDREDGLGYDPLGFEVDQTKCLKEIRLYARKDKEINGSNATPIKTVHFVYDYSLCGEVPNNTGDTYLNSDGPNPSYNYNTNEGKLTLRRVYFTHGESNRAWLSPYEFFYSSNNEDYALNAYDRWGNFKPKPTGSMTTGTLDGDVLSNADFPYVNNDPNSSNYQPDDNASMWALTSIKLPSGGTIDIDYEADDYAYVQHKKAMQMMPVSNVCAPGDASCNSTDLFDKSGGLLGADFAPNRDLVVDLPVPIYYSGGGDDAAAINLFKKYYMREEGHGYLKGDLEKLYFKFAVNVNPESSDDLEYEFVSGYADIESVVELISTSNSPSVYIGDNTDTEFGKVRIRLKPAKLKDDGKGSDVHPISKATWQMVRTYLYEHAFPASEIDGSDGITADVMQAMFGFIGDIMVMANGVNGEMQRKGIGKKMLANKSFVRLNNPLYNKVGGGHRVSQLTMTDDWFDMNQDATNSYEESDATYGKLYSYTKTHHSLKDEDGNPLVISSGVASYEPQLGGDENPFRTPVEYKIERKLYADDILYAEEPFGESLFPNPSVIYSHVEVRDYVPNGVTRTVNGTGHTVHEYYTAYDFPIKTSHTPVKRSEKQPDLLFQLLSMKTEYELILSQGYTIELNDMHGKEKAITVYPENTNGEDYVSRIEYKYRSVGNVHKALNNSVPTVAMTSSGPGVKPQTVNIDFDACHDSKQSKTVTNSNVFQGNVNVVEILGATVPIPTFFAQLAEDTRLHKMSTVTKVIQRYGILEEVVAEDQRSEVHTTNKLWDEETGQVLLTQVTNHYDENNDHYNFSYPAHWAYDGMGPAYKNIGMEFEDASVNDIVDQYSKINSPYDDYFVNGDEVAIYDVGTGSFEGKYWVICGTCDGDDVPCEASVQGKFLIDRDGALYNNTTDEHRYKIIRSGRRNMAREVVGSFTTETNPASGSFDWTNPNNVEVLQASAQEFTQSARVTESGNHINPNTNTYYNPFIWGAMDNWRPYKSWVLNELRDYSHGNLKQDGYVAFTDPFWVPNSGVMEKTTSLSNWQCLEENTTYNAAGFVVESKNEIGTYISQLPTLNNTAAKAIATNARQREIFNESFEDFAFADPNKDFNYDNGYWDYLTFQDRLGFYEKVNDNTLDIQDTYAHSGRYALSVPSEITNVNFEVLIATSNEQDFPDPQCDMLVPVTSGMTEWGTMDELRFKAVDDGKTDQFVLSYWRKLGTEPVYGQGVSVKDAYDDLRIDVDVLTAGSTVNPTITTHETAIIDGWQKVTQVITFTAGAGLDKATFTLVNDGTTTGYLDDIRLHPVDAKMMSYVYDIQTNRKVAELDENNFATFYEYNEAGQLIRTKKETERGIFTIQEVRDYAVDTRENW